MKVTGSSTKYNVIEYDDVLKSHLKIDDDTDQALVEVYIAAAGAYIEKYIGYPVLSTTVTIVTTGKGNTLELLKGATQIESVEHRQTDGTWEYVTLENETIDDFNMTVMFTADNIEDGEEYRVTAVQGSCVSTVLTHAAMLLVAEMYEQRENRVNSSVMRQRVNNILDMEWLPI